MNCRICGRQDARIRLCELNTARITKRAHVDCHGHSEYRSVTAADVDAAIDQGEAQLTAKKTMNTPKTETGGCCPPPPCSTIFVVIEEDMGMGETLLAAYPIRQKADEHAKESARYYVQECPFFSLNDQTKTHKE